MTQQQTHQPSKSNYAAYRLMLCVCSLLTIGLSGCTVIESTSNKTLELLGLKKPEVNIDIPLPPKTILFRLHTAKDMNANKEGKGFPAILRVFKLKESQTFLQASQQTLNADLNEVKQALASSLIDVREQIIMPNEVYSFKEKIDAKEGFIGITISFRNPNPKRWKIAFENTELNTSQEVIMGAHKCAMSVTQGALSIYDKRDPKALLGAAACPAEREL